MDKFHGPVLHTSLYKSGSDFRNQRVLVVGCGNSGMEVSLDLCRYNAIPHMVVRNTVHVLPREMFGFSTFGIAMAPLKWLPLKLVDSVILLVASFILGNTDQLGLKRPKTGPIELKNATGKTPVLDVGALSQIKTDKIKVMEGVKEITRNGARFINGQEKEFDSIILATWYKSNVPTWLKVVVDLDETLVCAYETCSVPAIVRAQATEAGMKWFEIECLSSEKESDGKPKVNYVTVFERPGLGEFLKRVCEFADLALFTAGLEDCARPLVDRIDVENLFKLRLYRPSTVSTECREHVKDLSCLSKDFSRVVIVDDNPFSFLLQPLNG